MKRVLGSLWLLSCFIFSIPVFSPADVPQRIVSMSPSVTEILYAIGAGDRVVGVTRFCNHPAEVEKKAKVGGYFDPDYEQILSLKPDLVVLLSEHEGVRAQFKKLNLSSVTVNHQRLQGILDSIGLLGDATGCAQQALVLSTNIQARLTDLSRRLKNLPRKNVLLSIGREVGTGGLQTVFAAGGGSFHGELLTLSGGKNVCETYQNYPTLAREGLLELDPEVILDFLPDTAEKHRDPNTVLKEWGSFPELGAVMSHQVFLFTENYTVIPGPRFVDIIEKMARVLHPEAWDQKNE